MPNARNPSLLLTQRQVDLIADALCSAKDADRLKPVDVWNAGLVSNTGYNLRDYVSYRWNLTRAGTTMRTNKILRNIDRVQRQTENKNSTDDVWEVKMGYYSQVSAFCVGLGGTTSEVEMIRQSAWLLWGWLWMDESDASLRRLTITKVGMGGHREAQIRTSLQSEKMNQRLVNLRDSVVEAQRKLDVAERQIEMYRDMVASVTATSLDSMLAGS
jgi:hypothetical protein